MCIKYLMFAFNLVFWVSVHIYIDSPVELLLWIRRYEYFCHVCEYSVCSRLESIASIDGSSRLGTLACERAFVRMNHSRWICRSHRTARRLSQMHVMHGIDSRSLHHAVILITHRNIDAWRLSGNIVGGFVSPSSTRPAIGQMRPVLCCIIPSGRVTQFRYLFWSLRVGAS